MAFRTCLKCGGIAEGSNICDDCMNISDSLSDAIIEVKGSNYVYEQEKERPGTWIVSAPNARYEIDIKDNGSRDGAFTCTCKAFQFRKKCKHIEALQSYFASQSLLLLPN